MSPVLIVISTCATPTQRSICKSFCSSLMKSFFSGSQTVYHGADSPMFRVERAMVTEIGVSKPNPDKGIAAEIKWKEEILAGALADVEAHPRRWLIVADAACIAMRNIDHLFPVDSEGPYAPDPIDFYWTPVDSRLHMLSPASPGIWAVRYEHFNTVMSCWRQTVREMAERGETDSSKVWAQVVQSLSLRKRPFEKGEIVVANIGSVNWEDVDEAAVVVARDWPEDRAWRFLQGLYFSKYLGDETGMMLDILES